MDEGQGRLWAGIEMVNSNQDEVVKSRKRLMIVIPAKAGSSAFKDLEILWTPVFTGETTFSEFIIAYTYHS